MVRAGLPGILVGTLLEMVQSNDSGLTLELWFKPATNNTVFRPIVTLGQEGPVLNSSALRFQQLRLKWRSMVVFLRSITEPVICSSNPVSACSLL
jgi:hypothetical protein